jgi:multiple sugar transport system substrate-binding protein
MNKGVGLMQEIRGMTWDHVRGISPLTEASKQFKLLHPNVEIIWDTRSLKDFEDYPIDLLASSYDILLIDHPFVGTGVAKQVLLPVDEFVGEEFLRVQEQNSVGKSYRSYTWDNKQWALAVDAASQVAAYREDIMKEMGFSVPTSWDEVISLINDLPSNNKVAIPLNPTHSYSSFLALCVNFGDENFWGEAGISEEIAVEALSFMADILPMLHPISIHSNPINISDLMTAEDEVIYTPLMYGYVPYARKAFVEKTLTFTNIPSAHGVPKGGVLGGVGLAISAFAKNKEIIGEFFQLVAGEAFQRNGYFQSGGQPGHRKAWLDPEVNKQSNNFFINTLDTLEHAYLRPRFIGYPKFQEESGEIIHEFLRNGGDAKSVIQRLNRIFIERKIASNS